MGGHGTPLHPSFRLLIRLDQLVGNVTEQIRRDRLPSTSLFEAFDQFTGDVDDFVVVMLQLLVILDPRPVNRRQQFPAVIGVLKRASNSSQ